MEDSVKKWMADDELMEKHAKKGMKWQKYVYDKLVEMGFPDVELGDINFKIEKDKTKVRNTYTKKDWDIKINGRVFEVKSRNLYFTGPEDMPFDDMLLDTIDGWDKKEIEPSGIIIVSQKTGKMVYASTRNKDQWGRLTVKDSTRHGIECPSYSCSKFILEPIENIINDI